MLLCRVHLYTLAEQHDTTNFEACVCQTPGLSRSAQLVVHLFSSLKCIQTDIPVQRAANGVSYKHPALHR